MIKFFYIIGLTLLFLSCSKKNNGDSSNTASAPKSKAAKYRLTDFQWENGIGPVKSKMTVAAEIDMEMVKKGKDVFDMKCIACHKLDGRFVGPSLRYVADRRTNEYIMNMMLNPDEMLNKHPLTKEMLKKYLNKMTFQNLSFEDCRNLLEYFRQAAKEGKEKSIKEEESFPALSDIK